MSRGLPMLIAALSLIVIVLLMPTHVGSSADSRSATPISEKAATLLSGQVIDELHLAYAGSTLWSGMINLEIENDFAYCCMKHGLLIVDVADQGAPARRGKVYFNNAGSMDIAVKGDYAYLTDFSGLSIIDISDADAPLLKVSYGTSGRANTVQLTDTLAFVADDAAGLLIINIADPEAPCSVAYYDTPGISKGIDVRDTLVYVADWGSGVQIVNVADPQNPQLLGGCDTIGYSGDLAVQDSFAYVAARFAGFQIVDIADPTSPYLVGGVNPANYVDYVAVADTIAILTCGDWPFPDSSVQIVNIADPENPYVMAAYATVGRARGLDLDGALAYIADYSHGLHIVDIGDPEIPTVVGRYETPIVTTGVVRAGDYAYVSSSMYDSWNASLYIVNVTDPTGPYIVGSCDTLGSGYRLAVADSMAYLVGYGTGDGLDVVNIADPQAPYLVTTASVPGYDSDVAVSGDYAYLAGESGMLVLDVSRPDMPVPTDSFLTEFPNYGAVICIADDLAYLLGNRLYVVNVSDPEDIYLEGSLQTGGFQTDIEVSGRYAYITIAESELMVGALVVIDIDSAQAPTWEAQFDTPVEALGVEVYGDYAFVSTYSPLIVINISDTENLYQAGYYTCASTETAVDAGVVYVAEGHSLLILNAVEQTCGDTDASGAVDVDDAVYVIAYIFSGGPPPVPLEVGDADCSGDVDIDDAVYLVQHIFSGGHAPCDVDGDGTPDC